MHTNAPRTLVTYYLTEIYALAPLPHHTYMIRDFGGLCV